MGNDVKCGQRLTRATTKTPTLRGQPEMVERDLMGLIIWLTLVFVLKKALETNYLPYVTYGLAGTLASLFGTHLGNSRKV